MKKWIKRVIGGMAIILVCNIVMQMVSYNFYKNAKHFTNVLIEPTKLQINEQLTGYGCNLEYDSDHVIILLGGSNYIAYNTIGKFGQYYQCPVLSIDYYGTQDSMGKMNLETMQQSVVELYEWAQLKYPQRNITVIGHSYGTGMAAYLASVKACENLILVAGYRDLADLYNKIIPIFWGPVKLFITNNIKVSQYAKQTKCKVFIMGSKADRTLGASLQKKVAACYKEAKLFIYEDIQHEDYLVNEQVITQVKKILDEEE